MRGPQRGRTAHRAPTPYRLLRMTAATAALVLLAGCGRGGPAPAPQAPESPIVPLAAAAELYYDDRGGIPEEIREVVRDEQSFRALWERATSPRAEPPPAPDLDFGSYMVLAVAAGRMNPGDRIQVDSAGVRTERTTEEEEEVFEAVIRVVEGCGGIQGEVYPLHIVRVPRFEGRVSFVQRTEQEACSR